MGEVGQGQHALVHLIQGNVAGQEEAAIAGQAEPQEGAAMPARRRPLVHLKLSSSIVLPAEAVAPLAQAFRQPTGKSDQRPSLAADASQSLDSWSALVSAQVANQFGALVCVPAVRLQVLKLSVRCQDVGQLLDLLDALAGPAGQDLRSLELRMVRKTVRSGAC